MASAVVRNTSLWLQATVFEAESRMYLLWFLFFGSLALPAYSLVIVSSVRANASPRYAKLPGTCSYRCLPHTEQHICTSCYNSTGVRRRKEKLGTRSCLLQTCKFVRRHLRCTSHVRWRSCARSLSVLCSIICLVCASLSPPPELVTSWGAGEAFWTRAAELCVRFISRRALAMLPAASARLLPLGGKYPGSFAPCAPIQPLGCSRAKDDSWGLGWRTMQVSRRSELHFRLQLRLPPSPGPSQRAFCLPACAALHFVP